ncbi:hypothetical protein SKAU_G00194890 [Synaphobranchus kaupii]|uniref:Potassium channel subfamily K member 2 n=1 Tax=Synaphobranchus kaupii TaxID=118154 RepID=A0A9Q1IXS4_SYNKA|nr:hypothetical protein SKAU_G00194890 [Synaphobranchus kaupii]
MVCLGLVAAPDLLDPRSATQNTKPRLSFSTKPVVLNSEDDFEAITTVMRWKTVSAIFLLVVLYLIIGATVFKALEQPHESSQKYAILVQKLEFLSRHSCVNSSELEDLVKALQELDLALDPESGRTDEPLGTQMATSSRQL